jgi:hypothetical protein
MSNKPKKCQFVDKCLSGNQCILIHDYKKLLDYEGKCLYFRDKEKVKNNGQQC